MPTFKSVFLPDSLVLSSTLSPDKKAVSILTLNLAVELLSVQKPTPPAQINVGRSLSDSQLVAARTGNIFIQLEGDEPSVTVQVDIRANLSAETGGRGVLISRLAGKTFVDELTTQDKTQDFTLRHTVDVSPASGLSATFLLLVDRDFVDGALPFVSAAVDSIDLVFEAPANAAN